MADAVETMLQQATRNGDALIAEGYLVLAARDAQ